MTRSARLSAFSLVLWGMALALTQPAESATEGEFLHLSFAVSPDSRQVAYQVPYIDELDRLATGIWIVNLDGSDQRSITTVLGCWNIYWYDQAHLALIAWDNSRIPIVPLADAEWRTICLTNGVPGIAPTVSPDGRYVVFTATANDPASGGLFLLNTLTGHAKLLASEVVKSFVSWSPDSKRIVFGVGAYQKNYQIQVIDVETGVVTHTGLDGVGAEFSPDGQWIAYSGEIENGGSWYGGVPVDGRIMKTRLDTLETLPLSEPAYNIHEKKSKRWEIRGAFHPRWSPDGTTISFRRAHFIRERTKKTPGPTSSRGRQAGRWQARSGMYEKSSHLSPVKLPPESCLWRPACWESMGVHRPRRTSSSGRRWTDRPRPIRNEPCPCETSSTRPDCGLIGLTERFGSRQKSSVLVHLQVGPSLKVLAVNGDTDQPLDGAQVLLVRDDGLVVTPWFTWPWARWMKEGQFLYEHLAPGSYLLTAGEIPWKYGEQDYGPERGSIRVVMSEGEDQEIKVRLKAIELTEQEVEKRWPYVVTGYVRDRLGNGMQGVEVIAHVGMGTLPQGGRVLSGPDGGYTLRFPAFGGGGGFVVVVGPYHPEYFERDSSRQGDLLPLWTDEPPRQTFGHPPSRWIVAHRPHALDFVMLPAVRVDGKLLDERGDPISECWVSVSGPNLPPASNVLGSMRTDATGSFHFDSLPPGYVRFELPDEEVTVETSFAEPGRHSVVLQMQRSPDGLDDVLLLRPSTGH